MYYNRSVEEVIKKAAGSFPCIVVYGARQVGKTTIMKMLYDDIKIAKYYFDLEDGRFLSICNNGIEDILSLAELIFSLISSSVSL